MNDQTDRQKQVIELDDMNNNAPFADPPDRPDPLNQSDQQMEALKSD
ncbi:hypothetical protein [Undibacterium sp. Xuan67W]